MKKRSAYDNMTASDLARITRERGLNKPDVITLREWADFLEADDVKRQTASQADVAAGTPSDDTEVADDDAPPSETKTTKKEKR